MTSRRELLRLGLVGAAAASGVAASGDEPAPGSSLITRSQLAPANMPVPYRALFRRPPELVPYQTGFDGGDPARPFARFALTQKLGQAQFVPGLSTTVAGYNGIFPGPDHPCPAGHADGGADRATHCRPRLCSTAGTFKHRHAPARFGVAAAVRRIRQRPHCPGVMQELPLSELAASPDALVPRPQPPRHGTGRVSRPGGPLPVVDPFERAQLPQGEFDVPLIISRLRCSRPTARSAFDDDDHAGFMGDMILVNGVPWPDDAGQAPGLPVPGAGRHHLALVPARTLPTANRCTSWPPTAA